MIYINNKKNYSTITNRLTGEKKESLKCFLFSLCARRQYI